MGMFDFIKSAGEKIFKPGETRKEDAIKSLLGTYGYGGIQVEVDGSTATLSGGVASVEAREKAVLIAGNIEGIDKVDDRLTVNASSSTPTATAGSTPNFGSVSGGVASTEAAMGAGVSSGGLASAGGDGWQSKTYTVEKGDTLSKIAREVYGNASKYQQIFEANKPMLKDPDKIYPGQVLRIPADN